jgi:uncharacterized membrane protein
MFPSQRKELLAQIDAFKHSLVIIHGPFVVVIQTVLYSVQDIHAFSNDLSFPDACLVALNKKIGVA